MSEKVLNEARTSELWSKVKEYVTEHGGSGSSDATFLVKAPIGTIVIWSGTADNIPSGWALCDGQDGRPDFRDKFVLGTGESHEVGETGGSEEVALNANQIPSHSHAYNKPVYQTSVQASAVGNNTGYPYSASTNLVNSGATGSGLAHPNMPPYITACYIIKISADETDTEDGPANHLINAPIGVILAWSGTEDNIPEGWHVCDGEEGTLDLRGKFVLGANASHAIGSTGGSEEVALTVEQMPFHDHTFIARSGSGTTTGVSYSRSSFDNAAIGLQSVVQYAGGNQPHPNMPPYYTLLYIQKIDVTPTDYATHEEVEMAIEEALANVSPGGGITNWSDISTIMHTVILRADSWDEDGIQTVSVLGVVANEAMQLIQPMPFTASQSLYYACNINCVSQTTDGLTFKATTIPQNDLTIYVAVINVQAIYGDNGNVPVLAHEWWSPQMTSDTTPAPYIVTSSALYGNSGQAYEAFDGVVESSSPQLQLNTQSYLQIYLQNLLSIGGFRIYCRRRSDGFLSTATMPSSFVFSASNDGMNWTVLKSVNGLTKSAWDRQDSIEFMLDFIATFRYYRFSEYDPADVSTGSVASGKIEFYI